MDENRSCSSGNQNLVNNYPPFFSSHYYIRTNVLDQIAIENFGHSSSDRNLINTCPPFSFIFFNRCTTTNILDWVTTENLGHSNVIEIWSTLYAFFFLFLSIDMMQLGFWPSCDWNFINTCPPFLFHDQYTTITILDQIATKNLGHLSTTEIWSTLIHLSIFAITILWQDFLFDWQLSTFFFSFFLVVTLWLELWTNFGLGSHLSTFFFFVFGCCTMTKVLVLWSIATKIRWTHVHFFFSFLFWVITLQLDFGLCCNKKSWLFRWRPKFDRHLSTHYYFKPWPRFWTRCN